MKYRTKKIVYGMVAALFIAMCVGIIAYATGGPAIGAETEVHVSGTDADGNAATYEFTHSFDSTYYIVGSYTASTDSADASVGFDSNIFEIKATSSAGKKAILSRNRRSAQNVSTECKITNASGKTLRVSYTYTVSNGTGGHDISTSGTFDWSPGTTYNFWVKTGVTSYDASSVTATTTFTITSCSEVNNYDFSIYSTPFATYSYSLGGGTQATLTPTSNDYATTTTGGTTITCTVPELADEYGSDYYFYGWAVNGTVVVSDEAYSGTVTTHTTVFPVIIKNGTAENGGPFSVNGTRYVFWKDAFAAAGSTYPVVVAENYTLPTTIEENGLPAADDRYIGEIDGSVSYIVPAGRKLLIPFDSGYTASFHGEPTNINNYAQDDVKALTTRNWVNCELIVPSGAVIECFGSINVNGEREWSGQPYTGISAGAYGKIVLGTERKVFTNPEESNLQSQLIVRSGGTLYCYGYITGSGMVEVMDGGTVHEFLQICCWPGGGNAYKWYTATLSNQSNNLFFLSQYYIQNIEAPLKVNYGGICKMEAVIYADELVVESSEFINKSGEDGLFLLHNDGAYILRIYDQSTDRMNYHIKGGTVDFGSIGISFTVNVVVNIPVNINSSNFILPINSALSIYVDEGATANIANKVALLPGAEVIVNGTANLSSQAYIFDVADWSASYFWNYAYAGEDYGVENFDPNVAPLPYIATLDDKSPQANALRWVYVGAWRPYTEPVNYTKSGKLEVNGTLNISGALCTTNGNSTADKVVTGTGTIKYTGTPSNGDLYAGYTGDVVDVSTTYGLGNLAGVGTLQPFAAGTYYGLGEYYDNYWYQWKVNATATGDTATGATVTGASNPVIGGQSIGSNVLVGYIANSNTTNGTFTFTVTPPNGYEVTGVTASNGTISDSDGTYTLTGVTADTTLTVNLTEKATGEVIYVIITWGSTTLEYTKGQWDPETHTYKVGSIETTTITITNGADTNVDLIATLTYEQATDYTGAVTGTLSATTVELDADATDRTHVVTLTLLPNGEHPTSGAVVGTVTVTISKPS